jgi:hypothetical protein
MAEPGLAACGFFIVRVLSMFVVSETLSKWNLLTVLFSVETLVHRENAAVSISGHSARLIVTRAAATLKLGGGHHLNERNESDQSVFEHATAIIRGLDILTRSASEAGAEGRIAVESEIASGCCDITA